MGKLKVFVASSERCCALVHGLRDRMKNEPRVDLIPWNHDPTSANNAHLLGHLQELSSSCDFAVVFLTKDHTAECRRSKRTLMWPSPNCVLELGLFMGAFGTPERCLVFSSLPPTHFADLGGQTWPPVVEPEDDVSWNATAWREDVIESAATAILAQIKLLGARDQYQVRAISVDELFRKESERIELDRDSRILVRAAQPAERRVRFAKVVVDNLMFGIEYHYLFDSAAGNNSEIGGMLRALAIASVLNDPSEANGLDQVPEHELSQFMIENARNIERNLERLRRRLYIQFVPFEAFEEFCIHNHLRDSEATGYLKWPHGRFVLMPPDKIAKRSNFYERFTHGERDTILALNKPKSERVRNPLASAILDKFPKELRDVVSETCFGAACKQLG